MGIPFVEVGSPIRRPKSSLLKEGELKRAVALARRQSGCRAILVLLDADDDCPKTAARPLATWAQEAAGDVPCSVVLANREYESWLIASLDTLLPSSATQRSAARVDDPEAKRDAKGELESALQINYSERQDQPRLTAHADLSCVHHRSRSFRKMAKEARRLFVVLGLRPSAWPN